jgi:hypothetical protein
MNPEEDAGDEVLAGVELHAWQVPPPPDHRPAILRRVLVPAAGAPRRRTTWKIAAFVALNAAVAAIVALAVLRPWARTTETVTLAGGAGDYRELVRLKLQQIRLEARIAELELQREQLDDKFRRLEDREKLDRTAPTRHLPSPDATSCDEVSCVLNNFEGACCARFKSKLGKPSELPELSRDMISTGMAAVDKPIRACGSRISTPLTIRVRVQVGGEGQVTNVAITDDTAVAACITAVVRKATFARSKHGGSFTYPFKFGPEPPDLDP